MITCLLMGGLGNQLFILFNTLSYAIDNNMDFSIKVLDCPRFYWNSFLENFKDKVIVYDINTTLYNEIGFQYKNIPNNLYRFTIKGYFQSYKYFEHNLDKILSFINFKNKQDIVRNKYSELFNKKSIVVHFRIGDYFHLQQYHCIKRPSYYIKSLEILKKELTIKGETLEDYNFLYFCQETDTIIVNKYLEEIKHIYPDINFIKVPDNIVDWEQLLIMSLCNHFIIGNSTFSWFGAYLSSYKNKIVCYPLIWFGPNYSHYILDDLFPNSWIKIDD